MVEAEIHFDRFEPNLSYKAHKETPTYAVGSLYDLGPHIIDQSIVLFGMPNAVFAHLDSFRDNGKVTDYFDLKLYYKSHIVSLKSSYFVCEMLPSFIFHGKNGSFIKPKSYIQEIDIQRNVHPNNPEFGIEPASEQGLLHYKENGNSVRKNIPSEIGNYMEFYDLMYESIRNNKSVPVSGEDGLKVIKIIEAALASNEEKRLITL
jgi:predicted dehydrogenase